MPGMTGGVGVIPHLMRVPLLFVIPHSMRDPYHFQLSIINYQFSIIKMSETTKKKNVWSLVLKIIVTVATALAGVFGVASCMA